MQKESVESFLARGGQIQKVPARGAAGLPVTWTGYIDGHPIPTTNQAVERILRPSIDDGTTSDWKQYCQESIPRSLTSTIIDCK